MVPTMPYNIRYAFHMGWVSLVYSPFRCFYFFLFDFVAMTCGISGFKLLTHTLACLSSHNYTMLPRPSYIELSAPKMIT